MYYLVMTDEASRMRVLCPFDSREGAEAQQAHVEKQLQGDGYYIDNCRHSSVCPAHSCRMVYRRVGDRLDPVVSLSIEDNIRLPVYAVDAA